MFDIYTIIFLALAVFIFFRLRSVLGQRTGRERPPFDYSARERAPAPSKDNVVPLPGRAEPDSASPLSNDADRWKAVAPAGSPVAAGLDAIAAQDPGFNPEQFMTGARAAYEMIVTAYAQGDKKQLKSLLGSDVYDGFESAINEREQRGETAETRFVSIDGTDLIGAEMRGKSAQLTIRFLSKLISATRGKDGTVVDGNPEKVTDVTDVWTFARDVSSRDPNWKLVATEAGQ